MAALPPVPQVLRLAFTGTINTSPWLVGLHTQYTGASLDTAGLNAMCSTWASLWDSSLSSLYPTGTTLRTVEAWDLTSAGGAYGSANVNLGGDLVGGGLSNNTALCVSWKVNYRWRGGHPRSYLPPPTSAETTGGNQWTAGFQAAAQTAAAAFLTNFNATASGGTTFKLVAVRYIDNNAPLATPLVLPIAAALVHSRIDSQRRRLGKEII